MDIKKSPIYAESWNVAYRKKKVASILDDKYTQFHILPNSFRYWAADPFVFEENGETFIFAELYDYVRRRGVLGYCKLVEEGKCKWQPIIVEDHHLSYPYIFRKGQDIYIMPEAGQSGAVSIYKAIQFPDSWKKVKELRMGVIYADTTPVDLDFSRYALAYDVKNVDDYQLKLVDFQTQKDVTILVDNVECRRPAGRVFQYRNSWIRPAQYCVGEYGKGLMFYECSLQDNEFHERLIEKIVPEDLSYTTEIYLEGMHTYNATDRYEVIDIKTRRFNILNFMFRIIGKIIR